jgi:hypothetical protein
MYASALRGKQISRRTVGETVARCKCKTNIGFDPAVPPGHSFYRANMTGVSYKKGTAGDKKFTIRHSMKARVQ